MLGEPLRKNVFGKPYSKKNVQRNVLFKAYIVNEQNNTHSSHFIAYSTEQKLLNFSDLNIKRIKYYEKVSYFNIGRTLKGCVKRNILIYGVREYQKAENCCST